MDKPDPFDIAPKILANNPFGITEVAGLRTLRNFYLERERYPSIVALIRAGNLADLVKLDQGTPVPKFREYLEISQFEDQNNHSYIVTVYDSDELWQNPEVIEISPLG